MTLLGTFVLIIGAVFAVIGAIGMLRFPDFYTRLHAASVIDTLAAGLILLGLALTLGLSLAIFKLIFIYALLLLTGPAATYALVKAAAHGGCQPQHLPPTHLPR